MLESIHSESPIVQEFRELGRRSEGVIIAYLMGYDPDPDSFHTNAASLIEGGADILEVGLPFSEPVADGPVIQAAGIRALSAGATPRKILDAIGKLTSRFPTPFIAMSYYNPILATGIDEFMTNAAMNGVSGVVVPDLPMEESELFRDAAIKHGIDSIFLAAPNTSSTRLSSIFEMSRGFVYLVSLYGVTGSRDALSPQALEVVTRVKASANGRIPVAAGFGISQPEHVSSLLHAGADGAIVGSALVRIVAEHLDEPGETPAYLKKAISALKQASKNRKTRVEAPSPTR